MSSLRDQIANVLSIWFRQRAIICEHTQLIEFGDAGDVLLAAVLQPALDAKDARLAGLEAEVKKLGWHLDYATALMALTPDRVGQAGAELAEIDAALNEMVFTVPQGVQGVRAVIAAYRDRIQLLAKAERERDEHARDRHRWRSRAEQAEAERDRLAEQLWLSNFDRERAETAIGRVRKLAEELRTDGCPWSSSAPDIGDDILAALDQPAKDSR